ncbi:lysozyme inhibitor LprI family protein [Rhodanobacter sp. C03]|uniref:lysozyme inhibitor LprI family protein n=1 Tax=Rhodanobacter sp. C03 TaxID=1945858 RepID=UPI00143924A0|nr:lysozyme inhibitor LprI family protein [Rhodanobacter sp. C03]
MFLWPVAWSALAIAATPPPNLQGTWDVVQVAVDQQDQSHWLYFPDDPRLLGRELRISASGISLNDDSRDCQKPVLSSLPKTSLQKFIGQSFPRPEHFQTPTYPTLSDYGLKLADAAVSPWQASCTPDASQWNHAWFILLSPDRLLTNDDNSGFVLVLRRRAGSTSIRPSFACDKAQSAAERTICTSQTLAGYDRSVTAAYHRALATAGDDTSSLKQEQISWLNTRNACNTDTECLAKSMRERVDQLMQQ